MRKIKQICLTFICSCFMGALTIGGAACGGDKQVTLSFNTNGGASVADVKLDVGENYVLQPLTREGYSFEGWYTSEDFSGEAVTEVVANSSVTYYAKWEQLYLVTLDLNDGELDYGKLYLKAGDVIYDSVKDFAPTKTGCQFGDWFVDEDMNKVLGKNTRMTENGITLYAKYKTSYTVEIWTEKLDEKGVYEKTADDVIGYEYAGVEYTSEQKVTGFREIVLSGDTYNSVTELTISETASENVFKHYFNRETYTVSFNANYPDGVEGKEYSVPVVYGNGVEVPSNYTYNGYCLMGWEVNGTVYDAKYIENALYGNETDVEADKFFPERNTTLYAVWQKGYVDMFGNGDYIYLFEDQVENEETGEVKTKYSVYLSRAGILFKGTYQASSQRFTFTNLDNDTTLQGKLNEDGTFIYRDQNRASITYERFVFGKGISNTEKIFFDDYNGVTYSVTKTVNGEEISDKSYGTFTINEDNLFIATFTEGTLAGQTLTMTLGYVPDTNGSYARAFQIRNDKELEFGEMIRFAVGLYEGNTYVNYYIYYGLTLNGFNTATVCEGDDKYVNYNYVYNEETSMLYLYEQGQSTPKQTCQIMELECFDGQVRKGYAVYNENLASSFYYAGGELVLDGYLNFTYERADGSVLEGYYTATESILGGMLVSFLDGKQLHNLVIERQEFALGGQTMVTYTVDEKSENYAEYYYLGNSGLLPYPVFVVNGDTASFYTHSSSAGYLEASRGTLVYDEATGLYTYTASPDFAGVEGDSLSNLEEVVLSLDAGETYYYSLHYWYSYKDKEGGALNYDESYTSAKGGKLTLVSGMAIYEEDGSIIKGIYQKAEDVVAIQNAKGELVYVKVDDENKTFVKMEYAPYTAYLYIGKDQVLSNSESISFDGLGGATYIVKTTVDEEPVETKYQGTVVKEDTTTLHGAYIFRFIPSEGEEVESFRFIQLTLGQYAIFAKEEKGVATVYESAEGRLELDGFGYFATYESVTGTYYFLSETEIVVDLNGEVRYFDVEGNTFTLRGKEYGYYMYSRNQYTYDVDFLLDGYGKLTVITYDKDGNESRVEGTYTQDGEIFTLEYDGLKKVGKLLYKGVNYGGNVYDIPMFIEDLGDEVSQKFLNPDDLSILELDAYGNAVKYTEKGVQEKGSYLLITNGLLYYVNETEDNACIYSLDVEEDEDGNERYTGVARIVKLDERGYYTEDLESLIFTPYGFAILENKTRYYYNVEYLEDGTEKVTIYRDAENDAEANEFGFVEIDFGEFSATKEYNGKTYYANDGYTVVFKRDKQTATQYEAGLGLLESLAFAPTGDENFSVYATVVISGKTYEDCIVTRNETGTYLYVENYCYDIELTYLGINDKGASNSSYKVTRMRQMVTAQPYMYWLIYMMSTAFGGEYENEEGELSIVKEYTLKEIDLGGGMKAWTTEEGETHLVTNFLEKSKFYDSNGNLVNVAAGTKIYDGKGNAVAFEKLDLTGKTGYTASLVGSDGYTYYIHFAILPSQYMPGMYEFGLTAFTREEKFPYTDATSGAKYDIALESTIASEAGYKVGSVFTLKLTKTVGETVENIQPWAWYTDYEGNFQVIAREMDGDKILSSVYYTFKFEQETEELPPLDENGGATQSPDENPDGEATEEENTYKNPVPLYTALLSVKEMVVKTIYAANSKDYIDVAEDTNKVMVINVGPYAYIVYSSTYDADGNFYMVKLSSTMAYKVTLTEEDGKETITIEQVEIKEESKEESTEEPKDETGEESTEGSEE